MHAVIKSLALVALAGSAMAASAQSASPSAVPAGLYIGADVGSATITDYGSKVGFGGFVGYSFTPNLAVEVSAHNLGTHNVAGVDVDASALTASVVGSVPVSTDLSLFGRLGYGSVTAAANGVKADINSAAYGVGASYKLNTNMALRAEYTRYASDVSKVGVGLQYKF